MEQPKKPTVVADLLPEQEKPKIESLPREEKEKGSNVESIPSEPAQKGDNSTVLPLPEEDKNLVLSAGETGAIDPNKIRYS